MGWKDIDGLIKGGNAEATLRHFDPCNGNEKVFMLEFMLFVFGVSNRPHQITLAELEGADVMELVKLFDKEKDGSKSVKKCTPVWFVRPLESRLKNPIDNVSAFRVDVADPSLTPDFHSPTSSPHMPDVEDELNSPERSVDGYADSSIFKSFYHAPNAFRLGFDAYTKQHPSLGSILRFLQILAPRFCYYAASTTLGEKVIKVLIVLAGNVIVEETIHLILSTLLTTRCPNYNHICNKSCLKSKTSIDKSSVHYLVKSIQFAYFGLAIAKEINAIRKNASLKQVIGLDYVHQLLHFGVDGVLDKVLEFVFDSILSQDPLIADFSARIMNTLIIRDSAKLKGSKNLENLNHFRNELTALLIEPTTPHEQKKRYFKLFGTMLQKLPNDCDAKMFLDITSLLKESWLIDEMVDIALIRMGTDFSTSQSVYELYTSMASCLGQNCMANLFMKSPVIFGDRSCHLIREAVQQKLPTLLKKPSLSPRNIGFCGAMLDFLNKILESDKAGSDSSQTVTNLITTSEINYSSFIQMVLSNDQFHSKCLLPSLKMVNNLYDTGNADINKAPILQNIFKLILPIWKETSSTDQIIVIAKIFSNTFRVASQSDRKEIWNYFGSHFVNISISELDQAIGMLRQNPESVLCTSRINPIICKLTALTSAGLISVAANVGDLIRFAGLPSEYGKTSITQSIMDLLKLEKRLNSTNV